MQALIRAEACEQNPWVRDEIAAAQQKYTAPALNQVP
jgi:hypothetical protein